MISWMVLSWTTEYTPLPMRLAGTIRLYSKKAMPQLTTIAMNSGALLYLRWPYQAKVMNTLLASSNSTGRRQFDRGRAGIVGPQGRDEARRIIHRRGPGGPRRAPSGLAQSEHRRRAQDGAGAGPAGKQAQHDADGATGQQRGPRWRQRQLEQLARDQHADHRGGRYRQQRRGQAQRAELHQHRAAQLAMARTEGAQHRAVVATLAGRGLQRRQQHQHA